LLHPEVEAGWAGTSCGGSGGSSGDSCSSGSIVVIAIIIAIVDEVVVMVVSVDVSLNVDLILTLNCRHCRGNFVQFCKQLNLFKFHCHSDLFSSVVLWFISWIIIFVSFLRVIPFELCSSHVGCSFLSF
jgi:hypothetical protein